MRKWTGEEKCDNCIFFYDKGKGGHCRRYPPQVFVLGREGYSNDPDWEQFWPYVEVNNFCGEYQEVPDQ